MRWSPGTVEREEITLKNAAHLSLLFLLTTILTLDLFIQSLVSANRGHIPFHPDVTIFEPNQRAMIAFNGEEQILLLSTDTRASRATQVLEVLPLPSEPEVTKGDLEVFRRATTLINRYLSRNDVRSLSKRAADRESYQEAGEVTFHKQIGPHDVSVTKVLQPAGFVDWVMNYLKKSGVPAPLLPQGMKELVALYINDGYRWFVFDVVSLEPELSTSQPIQYRFVTKWLYYPMRITSLASGHTTVELLVLTPRLLSDFPALPVEMVHLEHDPISLSVDEIRWLNPEMCDLVGGQSGCKLRIWNIRGRLSDFKWDLLAR